MKAHLLLADAAQTDPVGKVHALGLGWSITSTPTPPAAVVALIEVEWHETNQPFHFALQLLTEDGQPVLVPNPAGLSPLVIEGDLEAGRPPGLPNGTAIFMPITINLAPGIPLAVGQRYEWRLTIDDRVDETAPFYVAAASPTPAPPE